MARRRRDDGMVTVEAALALGALTTVALLLLAGFAAVLGHIRCLDAAREAARLTAAGQPGAAEAVVQRIAPRGAHLAIRRSGDGITAEVTADTLGGFHLDAFAYAVAEPGVPS